MYGLRDTPFPKRDRKSLKSTPIGFYGLTDRRSETDRETAGRMDRWMKTGMYGLRDTPFPKKRQKKLKKSTPIGFSDGRTDGRTDRRMYGRTDRWMVGWMDG